MPDSKDLLMDLPSLNGELPHVALKNLVWPTPYSTYTGITKDLIDVILRCQKDIKTHQISSAILKSKSYDIISDICTIARLTLDISTVREAGRKLCYNPQSSPLLTYLDVGTDPYSFVIPRVWHHPTANGCSKKIKNLARRCRSHLLSSTIGRNRLDIHNRNHLVNNFVQHSALRGVDWPITNVNWPEGKTLPKDLTEISLGLSIDFLKSIENEVSEKSLAEKFRHLSLRIIKFHLSKAYDDLLVLEKHVLARPMGLTLLSGTPKHLGRLTSWLYHKEGRTTIRCAHGGERAFFIDYEWGLAEFPDCDIYYTHGQGELTVLDRRISSGAIPTTDSEQPTQFQTIGSPHHQKIFSKASNQGSARRTGEVLYVAGGYLGEAFGDFPSRKPPDVLYLDWQIDLITTLKKLGYKVILKAHPGGIAANEGLLSAYADRSIEGKFDPIDAPGDCFIFDFAGTAFVDALASGRPMVLADTGVRPFDPHSFKDLSARCGIAPSTINGNGVFRVKTDPLGEAVAQATDNQANLFEDFQQKFFAS